MKHLILFLSIILSSNLLAWTQFNKLEVNGVELPTENTEPALPKSGTCPETRKDWMRVKTSAEKDTRYFNGKYTSEKLILHSGKIEIETSGCLDTKQTFTVGSDFDGTSNFPDNIVIPVKPGTQILDANNIKESELNEGMKKFIDGVKAKLAEGKKFDGTKDIIVYATASTDDPSCGAETGYDTQIASTFANTKSISNTELAFKRAVNAAKVIAKLLIVNNMEDSGLTKVKIKTHCSIKQGSTPALKVFGMLTESETVKTLTAPQQCGVDINVNGGIGNQAVPSYVEHEFLVHNQIKPELTGPSTSGMNMQTASLVLQRLGTTGFVDVLSKSYEWKTCKDKIHKPGTDGGWLAEVSGASYTFTKGGKQKASASGDCEKYSCTNYLNEIKKENWDVKTLIYCMHPYGAGGKLLSPGNYQQVINPSATRDYSAIYQSMTYSKGHRIRLNFDSYRVPDRFILTLNKKVLIDTGFSSCLGTAWAPSLVALGLNGISSGNRYTGAGRTLPNCASAPSGATAPVGTEYIFSETMTGQIKLHVFAPLNTTIWRARLDCPDENKQWGETQLVKDIVKKFNIK